MLFVQLRGGRGRRRRSRPEQRVDRREPKEDGDEYFGSARKPMPAPDFEATAAAPKEVAAAPAPAPAKAPAKAPAPAPSPAPAPAKAPAKAPASRARR